MRLKTISPVSVTTTAQRISLYDNQDYTLHNDSATYAIYYAWDESVATATYTGLDAALRTLGMSKLDAGQSVVLRGVAGVDVVCATGGSATLRIDAGQQASGSVTEANSAAIKAATEIMDDWDESDRAKVNLIASQAGITGGAGAVAANTPRVTHASDDPLVTAVQAGNGNGLTFQTPIAITQAGAGRTTILALEAAKVIRLHALVLTADAAGTVYIAYDDDGAGTNEVKLTGVMPVAANGGFVIPFSADGRACLRTAAGKQLTLVSATAKVFGYAVASKA